MKKSIVNLPDQKSAGRRNLKAIAEHLDFEMPQHLSDLGEGRSYYVRTYGCQANVRDGETISGLLEEMHFHPAQSEEDADLLIFNTCAIRKAAEDHVLGEIGNLKPLKIKHPEKIFAVCGCMAQEEGIVRDLIEKYPQVDLVFGTHNLHELPELLEAVMKGERRVAVYSEEGRIIEGLPSRRIKPYKAFVNIMYGCDKFCTYCIVPYTRGKQRSRREEDILREIRSFKEQGGREVQLLGQNVNAYGKDFGIEDGFTKLLESCAGTGIDRIRFYTSHPRDYSITTIDAMRNYPSVMKSLHLPVQSGSDEVLRRMNRGYTSADYKRLVDEMKARIPDITFTTDLIVGFPGETDEQFRETLDLVDYCQFDSAFTFIFSPREGTPAAKFEDTLSQEVKKERLQILNDRIGLYAKKNNDAYVGKTLKVLCEGPSRKRADVFSGYSEENKLVNFTGNGLKEGEIYEVLITGAKSYTLDGEAVSGHLEIREN